MPCGTGIGWPATAARQAASNSGLPYVSGRRMRFLVRSGRKYQRKRPCLLGLHSTPQYFGFGIDYSTTLVFGFARVLNRATRGGSSAADFAGSGEPSSKGTPAMIAPLIRNPAAFAAS